MRWRHSYRICVSARNCDGDVAKRVTALDCDRTELSITKECSNMGEKYLQSKGKVIPLQARCGPEGGQRYSSALP